MTSTKNNRPDPDDNGLGDYQIASIAGVGCAYYIVGIDDRPLWVDVWVASGPGHSKFRDCIPFAEAMAVITADIVKDVRAEVGDEAMNESDPNYGGGFANYNR